MHIAIMLLIMLLLLILKGFFSGSEIALVNADKMHLTHRANHGHRGSQLVLRLYRTPEVLLTTTLVGTNLSTIMLSTIGTLLMLELVGEQYGDLAAFVVYTPVFLILGEVVPKSVYQQKSDDLAPLVVYPLRVFYFLTLPLVFIFSRIARLAARLSGAGAAGHGLFITREQVRSVVEMAERGSNVGHFDRIRIRRAIRFAETTVGEAMVPIADVVAINRKRGLPEVIDRVRKRGYNRLPVYDNNISNVVGVATITTWDLMDPELPQRELQDLMQPAHYVTQYETIDQLLPILKARTDHLAIVVDEYGSAVGIITMEDIIEEVVGDIDVGLEFEEYLPRKRRQYRQLDPDNETYQLDARLPISELNDLLGLSLPTTEFHTVAGLLIARLRHIPREGDNIVEGSYRFTVDEASDRSVRSVIVERDSARGSERNH
ncbi:MAG: hemolysin family protein [Planctomycetota bacterium]|nr:hemolysin family protein [Planctomycetota bacterium]